MTADMLNSYARITSEPVDTGTQRFESILAASTSILTSEQFQESFEIALEKADVLFVTLDLDGAFITSYDQRGRPIDDQDRWTDPMFPTETRILGESFIKLKETCEAKGKIFLLGLNSTRELDLGLKVLYELPPEISDHCLMSLEGGHVKAFKDRGGAIVVQSLPEQDLQIKTLKETIGTDLQVQFDNHMMGVDAYKPNRQGMVTYRSVDPKYVGWNEETKTISGPLLSVLEKYGYPHNPNFQVVYYPFDGGLDIRFTKFSKQTGEVGLIDTAVDLGLIQPEQRVLQVHEGDTMSDALNGSGTSEKGICYDVFTVAVAGASKGLLEQAKATSQSKGRWGIYEINRLLEDMLKKTRPVNKEIGMNGSIIKLLESYLGPEHPTETDFNLREAINNIDLEKAKDLVYKIRATDQNGGRVFIIGNGGSYDNARLISMLLRAKGINADVPGSGQKYLEAGLKEGHDFIFEKTLEDQNLNEKDMVIAISGSGYSPNILRAIEFAQKTGSEIVALGGRDGGPMAKLVGNKNAFIAKSNTMEIIEDIHGVIGYMVATSLESTNDLIMEKLEQQKNQSIKVIEQLLHKENTQAIAKVLLAIEKTLITKGRIIMIGDSLSTNHVRADMARGATNQLPFSFRVVENIGSTNSMLATQNDDGPDFTLAHALENIRPEIGDVVIILNSPGRTQDRPLDLCYQYAQDHKAQVFLIGHDLPEEKADVSFDGAQADYELMTTIMADLFGRTLHEHLVDSMDIRIDELNREILPHEAQAWLKDNLRTNRKIGERDTLEFEKMLRSTNISTDTNKFIPFLPEDKVVVFCYGKMFVVDSPDKYGLERAFY